MQKGEVRLKLIVGRANEGRMLFMAGLCKQLMEEGKSVLVLVEDVSSNDFIGDYLSMAPEQASRNEWEGMLNVRQVRNLSDVVQQLVECKYDSAVVQLNSQPIPDIDLSMSSVLNMDVLESISRVLQKDLYLSVQLHESAFKDSGICMWSMSEFNQYVYKKSFPLPESSVDAKPLCDSCASKLRAKYAGFRVRGMVNCSNKCGNMCSEYYTWW